MKVYIVLQEGADYGSGSSIISVHATEQTATDTAQVRAEQAGGGSFYVEDYEVQ